MSKIPQPLSEGEEQFAQHLDLYKIPYGREVRLVPGRKYRWDFLVGDLAIEIHGATWRKGGHSTGSGILRDCRKLNAAVLAGYRPLVFTSEMVLTGEAIDTLRAALRQAHPS
ncbi:hypothetical protein KGP36_05970 [Patescibacteria group bacterium]|nr:hypothetical protein [Patescibacteria group bacterium]